MTLAITHAFVTLKTDGLDTSLLRPSNWNAGHVVTMATNMLVGRASIGAGDAEEIPCSAAARTILAATDIAAILLLLGVSPSTTGDGKVTLKTVADSGWVMMDDGTIGNAASAASNRANADTAPLFTLLYNNVLDASAPVTTSAGAATTRALQGTAATAYAANCRIALPKQLGRAIVAAGTGAGLTARALGSNFGAETHTLAAGENGPHDHDVFLYDPGHLHGGTATGTNNFWQGGGNQAGFVQSYTTNTASAVTGVQVRSAAGAGAGTQNKTAATPAAAPHNNMQPSTFWNVMVKL